MRIHIAHYRSLLPLITDIKLYASWYPVWKHISSLCHMCEIIKSSVWLHISVFKVHTLTRKCPQFSIQYCLLVIFSSSKFWKLFSLVLLLITFKANYTVVEYKSLCTQRNNETNMAAWENSYRNDISTLYIYILKKNCRLFWPQICSSFTCISSKIIEL